MLKKALFLLFVFCSFATHAKFNQIETYDLRSYRVQESGLKDLSFDVRVDGLLKDLNESKKYGRLNDVYVRVYWTFPNKRKISVEGVPSSFDDLRKMLRGLVEARLDFVLPSKLASRVKMYALEKQKSSRGFLIVGEDKSQKSNISRIEMVFDKRGRMSEFVTYEPQGRSVAKIDYVTKSWSKNKWLRETLDVTVRKGIILQNIKTSVKYVSVGGFGFPEEIVVKSEVKDARSGEATSGQVQERKILFSNFQVNTGLAKKVIEGK